MSKKAFLISIALILSFSSCSFFQSEQPKDIKQLETDSSKQGVAILETEGNSMILKNDTWQDLETRNDDMPLNSAVKTEKSSLSILLPDNTIIRVGPDSELLIKTFTETNDLIEAEINLAKGHIWLNIDNSKKHKYIVLSPNLMLKSTTSIIEVEDRINYARVASHKDQVDITVRHKDKIVSETNISSKQKLEFRQEDIKDLLEESRSDEIALKIREIIKVQELDKEDLSTDFYLYNTELDRKSNLKDRLGSIKREVKNLYNLKPEKHKIISPEREISLRGTFQILPPDGTKIFVADMEGKINGLDWIIEDLPLREGRNTFDILVNDFIADRVVVIKDTISPDPVVVTYPKNESLINRRYITVEGTYSNDAAEVLVGSKSAFMENGKFSAEVELQKGENKFQIKAIDQAKNIGPETILTLYREYRPQNLKSETKQKSSKQTSKKVASPKNTEKSSYTQPKKEVQTKEPEKQSATKEYPAPKITHPNGGADYTTCNSYIILRGTVPENSKAVYINGIAAAISASTWSKRMNIYEGQNKFDVSAINIDGQKSKSSTINITRHDCSKSY